MQITRQYPCLKLWRPCLARSGQIRKMQLVLKVEGEKLDFLPSKQTFCLKKLIECTDIHLLPLPVNVRSSFFSLFYIVMCIHFIRFSFCCMNLKAFFKKELQHLSTLAKCRKVNTSNKWMYIYNCLKFVSNLIQLAPTDLKETHNLL